MKKLAIVVIVLVAACGGAQKRSLAEARRGVSTALAATSAARDAFAAWSEAQQHAILAANPDASEAEDRAALEAFRARRQPVLHAFAVAYTSIAAAGTALAIAGEDVAQLPRAMALAGDALRAVLAVREAISDLRGAL